MKIFLISLALSAVLFVGGGYQRYDAHAKRIADLQNHLVRVHTAIAKSSWHVQNRFRRDFGGFASAANSLNGDTYLNDIPAISRMLRRIRKVQREQSQFDRDVAEYEQNIRDITVSHSVDKASAGDFEQYNHSSDALRDTLVGFEGAFKAAQTNPELVPNEGDPLGKDLSKNVAAYVHNMNLLYYGEENDVDDYKKQERRITKQLHDLKAQPFWT